MHAFDTLTVGCFQKKFFGLPGLPDLSDADFQKGFRKLRPQAIGPPFDIGVGYGWGSEEGVGKLFQPISGLSGGLENLFDPFQPGRRETHVGFEAKRFIPR
jgi:hypothetical protein